MEFVEVLPLGRKTWPYYKYVGLKNGRLACENVERRLDVLLKKVEAPRGAPPRLAVLDPDSNEVFLFPNWKILKRFARECRNVGELTELYLVTLMLGHKVAALLAEGRELDESLLRVGRERLKAFFTRYPEVAYKLMPRLKAETRAKILARII